MLHAHTAPFARPRRWRGALVVAAAAAAILGALALPRIAQDPAYHAFADARAWAGVPSAANVLSNAMFLAVGAAGLIAVGARRARFADSRERLPWLTFFATVALVGPGSAWYHLAPSNATLVWDRLPMAAGFGAVLAAIVGERIRPAAGGRLLAPLVSLGALSVAYWHFTEARGAGDLRPYALVQLFPMLAIPLLSALFPARYTRSADWLVALGLYALAKAAELGDAALFRAGDIVSGHTLKHVLAALAIAVLVRMLVRREPLRETGPISG
jgi:hypothetical protein